MKRMLLLLIAVLSSSWCIAADLPAPDAALIETAGIPIYGKSVFAYGNADVGFRFATSEPAEAVRQWYLDQLKGWSVYDQYGGWIIYNGQPTKSMAEIMSTEQVMVQPNANLPEWHGLDKAMTTEIVIMIPK